MSKVTLPSIREHLLLDVLFAVLVQALLSFFFFKAQPMSATSLFTKRTESPFAFVDPLSNLTVASSKMAQNQANRAVMPSAAPLPFAAQFHAARVHPSQFAAQREAEAAMIDEAFAFAPFVANRICPWCAKFCHEDHIAQCDRRCITCPICNEIVLATEGIAHYQQCQDLVITVATERVMSRVNDRRRLDEEEAERKRVQRLTEQAEAQAAALRNRANSMVTRKQSIGNLLFSGVSLGDRGVESAAAKATGESPPAARPSEAKLQPEQAPAATVFTSGGAASTSDGQPPQAPQSLYNRAASFFSRTADKPELPPPSPSTAAPASNVESEDDRLTKQRSEILLAPPSAAALEAARRHSLPVGGLTRAAPQVLPARKASASPANANPAPPSVASNTNRGSSVESSARGVSTASSASYPPGAKKCKWCSLVAPIEHEKRCASRIVMCKKCQSMIKMKDKDEHVKICPGAPPARAE